MREGDKKCLTKKKKKQTNTKRYRIFNYVEVKRKSVRLQLINFVFIIYKRNACLVQYGHSNAMKLIHFTLDLLKLNIEFFSNDSSFP